MQPGAGKAVAILIRELGFFPAIAVLLRLIRREQRGDPFGHLPPAEERKERESREQIGPALILYDELKERVSQARALQITEEIAVAGALAFLKQTVGPLTQEVLGGMDERERRAFVEQKGEKFPNSTMKWEKIGSDEVVFQVTSCRFPRLCKEAGVPELAPIFCKGDATFFGTVEPNVELIRPQTIAGGAQSCHFTLKWVGAPMEED